MAESNFTLINNRLEVLSKHLNIAHNDLLKHFPHLKEESTLNLLLKEIENDATKLTSVSHFIDHTVLKATATSNEIDKLCIEAKENNFYAVCVNSSRVELVKSTLSKLNCNTVMIAAVCGFPLGSCTTATKSFEAEDACKLGAKEIDMVINIGYLMDQDYKNVHADILAVVTAAKHHDAKVKVIFETGYLNKEQIIDASILSVLAGAHFVKTSTGFGQGGAKVEDVLLMKSVFGLQALVKASGGVRSYAEAIAMIKVGASRIGTSSGIAIVKGGPSTSNY